jgi:ribonucleoside-diphosphate reductase alpha chain
METPTLTVDETKTTEERLTDNVVDDVLPARYLRKDENGEIVETPDEMFHRVAHNVAEAQRELGAGMSVGQAQRRFYEAMSELRFMPNSPTLMNAGTDMNQLSACFVLHPEDDMEDIYDTAKNAALTFQSGGGVGYPFHLLRPKGAYIESTGGVSSGPVDFMRTFDVTCSNVKQGGKRRGAQMGIMRVDHPDIGRFIVAKRTEGALSNFNISVGVTDDFVEAVENDELFTLYDPETDFEDSFDAVEASADFYDPEYRNNPEDAFGLGDGKPVDENLWRDHADEITVSGDETFTEKWAGEVHVEEGEKLELPARFLWDIMVDGAWRNGEPGIFNYDATNQDHTFNIDDHPEEQIEATNPCAEQPLQEYEACNLGHINLSLMLRESAVTYDEWCTWTEDVDYDDEVRAYVSYAIDRETFRETIETATIFLDNVVTQSDFPTEEIQETVSNYRKTGVGIMGLAQMLYQMGVPYDSEIGRDIAAKMMKGVQVESTMASAELARKRGAFEGYEDSKWADPQSYPDWFRRHSGGLKAENYPDGLPVRNHKQTTIAPCGTTSMIGDTSGGCEPVYSVAFYKNVGGDIQGDGMLVEFDSYFLRTLDHNGLDPDIVRREAEEQMEANEWDGVGGLSSVPEEYGDVFVTTEQIAPEDHVLMQRRLQEWTDSGISKTINLPEDATHDDVGDAYELSLTEGVGERAKGLTVYRDGSRNKQVKTTDGTMGDDEQEIGDPIEMYQSDEITDEEVERLVMVKNAGDDEELCPECEEGVMQMQEGCGLCSECGFSYCN